MILILGACSDDGDRDDVRTDDATTSLRFRLGRELTDNGVDQLTSILENRLNALGTQGASVTLDGDDVILEIPESEATRVRDMADVLGTTAELRFRPVLQTVPLAAGDAPLSATPPEEDFAPETVVLDQPGEARYLLGPAELTGSIVEDAVAQLDPSGRWSVALTLTEDGIVAFNELAGECFPPSGACPTGQLAIVLDSEVRSAPTVQAASFERGDISISGDFTEAQAKDLALVLRYGPLPTSLDLVMDLSG
ncbi:MAG: preprotein translocase subunit SecD [Acidimicrobiales bacterium]